MDGMPDAVVSSSDSDTSDCTENDDYDIDYNEPINGNKQIIKTDLKNN